jgi:hypothetical protein
VLPSFQVVAEVASTEARHRTPDDNPSFGAVVIKLPAQA